MDDIAGFARMAENQCVWNITLLVFTSIFVHVTSSGYGIIIMKKHAKLQLLG